MPLEIVLGEGSSFSSMVRGAGMALAIARRPEASIRVASSRPHVAWRHLLSASDQLALFRLDPQRQPRQPRSQASLLALSQTLASGSHGGDAWRAAARDLEGNHRQALIIGAAAALPWHPWAGTWALSSDSAHALPLAVRPRYGRLLAFTGERPSPAGIIGLPEAVERVFLERPPRASPSADGRVVVVACGEPARDLVRLTALRAAGVRPCLFDPYLSRAAWGDVLGPLLADDGYRAACDPAGRAAFFRAAGQVAGDADDHFVLEARAMGLRALPAAMPAASAGADWLAAEAQPEAAPLDWDAWAQRAAQALAGEVAPSPPADFEVRVHGHRVRVGAQMPPPPEPGRPAIIVFAETLPGHDAASAWQEGWRPGLRAYQKVIVETGGDLALFRAVSRALVPAPLVLAPDLEDSLAAVLAAGATPATVDIVLMDAWGHWHGRLRTLLAGLGGGPPPRIVLFGARPDNEGAKRAGIGATTASDAIAQGIVQGAPGRYHLRYCRPHTAGGPHSRIYLYPYGAVAGLSADEVDMATLPHLLGRGDIDLILHLDPFQSYSAAARARWATRPVPIVALLHAVHTARGSNEVLTHMLSGSMAPYDAIVSPSHCGRRAYQGLLDAVAEHLAARGVTPAPRYPGDLLVVPYGIDTRVYSGQQRLACRLGLDLDAGPGLAAPLIVSVGRFVRHDKACLLPLIIAVARLRRVHPEARLVLAGARSMDGSVEALVDLAKSLGVPLQLRFNIDLEDKAMLLAAADVFVAMGDNIQETFGISILEAMAAGRPVVASAWDGHRELVVDGETGFLVDTTSLPADPTGVHLHPIAEYHAGLGHRDLHETTAVDVDMLTARLATLLADPALGRSLGEAGRARCEVHFEREKQGRALGEVLLERRRMAGQAGAQRAGGVIFSDPVAARFAHYASRPPLADATRVAAALGPDALAPAARRALEAAIGQASGSETRLCDAIVALAAAEPGIRLAELGDRLAHQHNAQDPSSRFSLPLDRHAVMARAARCLKYGLIKIVEGAA